MMAIQRHTMVHKHCSQPSRHRSSVHNQPPCHKDRKPPSQRRSSVHNHLHSLQLYRKDRKQPFQRHS
jgi:hypothetical protein